MNKFVLIDIFYLNPYMSLATVSGCLKQTVVRQGSLVFCVSKSFEAEREQMKPPECNERVCEGQPDTVAYLNGKYGLKRFVAEKQSLFHIARITVNSYSVLTAVQLWRKLIRHEQDKIEYNNFCGNDAPAVVLYM
jgi:hypothetical protein